MLWEGNSQLKMESRAAPPSLPSPEPWLRVRRVALNSSWAEDECSEQSQQQLQRKQATRLTGEAVIQTRPGWSHVSAI